MGKGIWRLLGGLVCFLGLSSAFSVWSSEDAKTEAPEAETRHNIRAESPSVVIKKSPWDFIQFVYNRGDGAVNFLDLVLDRLGTQKVKALPGYTSPQKTRFNYKTYEFRSREIYDDIKAKLEAGYHVRFVADAGPHTFVPALSKNEYEALSPEQQKYYDYQYLNSVILPEDLEALIQKGKTDPKFTEFKDLSPEEVQKRIEQFNKRRSRDLSVAMMEKLKELEKKYPKQMELVLTPLEIVPRDSRDNYVRLSHFKGYGVDFLDGKGKWIPQSNIECSANATDSCMGKGRISDSEGNKAKYLNGEEYNLSKGSTGNIQFGAEFHGPQLLSLLEGPVESWIKAYKQGEHFDSVDPPSKNWPIVVFEDPATGHRTLLRSYFSEGTKHPDKTTTDLVYHAATDIWSRPEIKLVEYLGSEFVMTHTELAGNLRHQLAKAEKEGSLKNVEIFVDGNFATKPYSALPNLLFSVGRSNSPGVLSGKALREGKAFPESQKWQDKVFVFEGQRGVWGSEGDKLHTKLRFFSYLDSKKVLHGVLIWGSGNNSKNANKLNADVIRSLDTTDPKIIDEAHKFFAGLKTEARMRSYANALIEKLFYQTVLHSDGEKIFPRGDLEDVAHPEGFLSKFQEILDGKTHEGTELSVQERKERLGKALETIKEVGAKSSNGENVIKILEYYHENFADLRPLNWADFYLLHALANPEDYPQKGLVKDYLTRWSNTLLPSEQQEKSFNKLISSLVYSEKAKGRAVKMNPTVMKLFENCNAWFEANGVGGFEPVEYLGGRK